MIELSVPRLVLIVTGTVLLGLAPAWVPELEDGTWWGLALGFVWAWNVWEVARRWEPVADVDDGDA